MKTFDSVDGQTLVKFGEKYKLNVRRDECGDPLVSGSRGNLYEYGPGEISLAILSDGDPRPRLWKRVKKECLEAGMTLHQNGDAEGSLSFDPENTYQARLAIKILGVRPRKQISEEHKASLLAGLKRYQESRSDALRGIVQRAS